jgi:hypothetical protein
MTLRGQYYVSATDGLWVPQLSHVVNMVYAHGVYAKCKQRSAAMKLSCGYAGFLCVVLFVAGLAGCAGVSQKEADELMAK